VSCLDVYVFKSCSSAAVSAARDGGFTVQNSVNMVFDCGKVYAEFSAAIWRLFSFRTSFETWFHGAVSARQKRAFSRFI